MAHDVTIDLGPGQRFRIDRRLGAGGFGVVYEAFDQQRGHAVALKTLRHVTPDSLYRFKREFRSLCDFAHPNLIQLYELFADGEEWFFTMELVRGATFLDFVWTTGPAALAATDTEPMDATQPDARAAAHADLLNTTPVSTPADPRKLRRALRQLAEGVGALHAAGKLHRDIKPSNVLVGTDGRLTLLDFGLVTELAPDETASIHVAGTPAYMSPEQTAGKPLTTSTDWYSTGVMLYQALTGNLPFSGSYFHIAAEKQKSEPPMPALVVAGVPPDLNELCVDLLHIDPERRPDGTAILERLSDDTLEPQLVTATSAAPPPLLIGREAPLAALRQAFADSRNGAAVVVAVEGISGVGKSALVRHFLAALRHEEPEVVVFSGRCYERESVPYKAVDAVIDDLSRYLGRRPSIEVEALMPRDAPALARLFPVLRQVENVVSERRRHAAIPDAHEMRRRAFQALRELLIRLADQRPVVLFIDDVQWGDIDSALLLEEVLRLPDPPPLLLLACYRAEEVETSAFLRRVTAATSYLGAELRRLRLQELSGDEAAALARTLLAGDASTADAIATESAGSPLFIDQLVRYARSRSDAAVGSMSLAEMIGRRVADLPPVARSIVEAATIHGRPLAFRTIREAFELPSDADHALAVLRAEHLVRTREGAEGIEVEVYHDRIRETVAAQLPAAAARLHHLRLAVALQQSKEADAELLADHFAAAGDAESAGKYALLGAAKAHDALAFDRAARLYGIALDSLPLAGEERRQVLVRRGDALVGAGRGAEAAAAYLAAAGGADEANELELRRRAAEQLLLSGHLDDGFRIVEDLLGKTGMRLPKTPVGTIASLLWHRLRLRLRGFSFEPRSATEVPPRELVRVDMCWSVGIGLGMTDVLRGAVFQTRNLLLALECGEPYRISRALSMETGFHSVRGGRAIRAVDRLGTLAHRIADDVKHPHALALVTLFEAVVAWERGEWRKGKELADRGEQMLRATCTGVAWELATAQIFSLASLNWLGEWRELAARLPALLQEAEGRGDLYAGVGLRLLAYSYSLLLAADDAAGARHHIAEQVARWSSRGFHLQHFWASHGEVEIELYLGEGERARERLARMMPLVRRSLLLQVQTLLIFHLHLCGRVAIVTGRLRLAARYARAIEREKMLWGNALGAALRAGIEASKSNAAAAIVHLQTAEDGLRRSEMSMFADAARLQRGRLANDAVLIDEAERSMSAQGVRAPAKLAAMLVPAE